MRIPALLIPLIAFGCGAEEPEPVANNPDTFESLAAESIALMTEYVALLEKVTDVESARRHRAEIEQYRTRLGALKLRSQALGEMTAEQAAALNEKYGEQMQELTQKQGKFGMRIGKDPALRAALEQEEPEPGKSD